MRATVGSISSSVRFFVSGTVNQKNAIAAIPITP
jgi:hypothetical protein